MRKDLEYVRSLERYAAYVGRNLDRIQSDGFVPLSFEEFMGASENSDDYYGEDMMKKVTIVQVYSADELGRERGQAVLARLEEPIEYGDEKMTDHIIISAARVGETDEVYLFPADSLGAVLDWLEIEGSQRGTLSIRQTMTEAGYDVSSWPEEVN